ncbi:aldehyde dehydrogenase (NADP(+)) [Martelella endophytica]|uniref:2,5-dioxovalerate dehydrogenase n=1 Tax=Martelella endophytica TaxID=1486262 RepID=A0A0D5LPE2_MAREN|nr:aldehyde dehydrogenase (NADP(+)) [Martelella endophytica]AJY45815.1 2,5-dioxovalerate dehydrogenase [Martelella endophytica]
MTYTPHGKHLIGGEWTAADITFSSAPASGTPHEFSEASEELIDEAVKAAEAAFWSYGYSSRKERAAFLERIADEIEARADDITAIGTAETGLPAGRLQGERGRTTGQLRMFAQHILKGAYLDRRHDVAIPDKTPPRPDLRMIERPIGPVAVFGASNFPLAFSTAGGDTASALAAGCPVVVKGHPAHPGTAEIVAEAILAAIEACGVHPGVFSLVQGASYEAGGALVTHPLIKAVGFTGSLKGGKALFDLCAARDEPIPFFGELGSVNPNFLLPEALGHRGKDIAKGWAASLTMGVGQFCTNPGIMVTLAGPEADGFAKAAAEALGEVGPAVMLTEGIARAYRGGAEAVAGAKGVETLVKGKCEAREGAPALYRTTGKVFLDNPDLAHEVFGPLGIIVMAADAQEMRAVAERLEGQLTCTLHMERDDTEFARTLLPVLERKAGRLLANGFATGVEVSDAMVHSGPYPASTNFGATSVGTLAIRRFLRPVCYQNIPEALLPEDIQHIA